MKHIASYIQYGIVKNEVFASALLHRVGKVRKSLCDLLGSKKMVSSGEKKEAAISPHHHTLLRVPLLNGFGRRWRIDKWVGKEREVVE